MRPRSPDGRLDARMTAAVAPVGVAAPARDLWVVPAAPGRVPVGVTTEPIHRPRPPAPPGGMVFAVEQSALALLFQGLPAFTDIEPGERGLRGRGFSAYA